MNEEEAVELYRKLRPKSFKAVVGQAEACKQLKEMLDNRRLPRALLFTGPSGVGKTTLARILKVKLDCSDGDFHEINVAESRGIDSIREVQSRQGLSPMGGKVRMFLWDECHRWTGDAMSALLKTLEDIPKHIQHVLCTTDPQKLLPTIKTRCTEIKLKAIPAKDLMVLIDSAAEGISAAVAKQIAEVADGSARKALVLLHQVMGLETEAEQLEAVQRSDTKRQAIDLARAIINPEAKWSEVAAIIEGIEDDPEGVRRLILAYAGTILKKGGAMAKRANYLITTFESSIFETGASGRAILASRCWDVTKFRD